MIRLALLVCTDLPEPIKCIHGDCAQLFHKFLSQSLKQITLDVSFTLDAYDVVQDMVYPPDDKDYDGILISGSETSAYEDIEWVNKLLSYIKHILVEKPSLKIFGICFGHQMIARALGGSCVPNKGLEVAVTAVQLTPLGKVIFGTDQLEIQQIHKDHIAACPPDAHLLGSSSLTPVQGMVVFEPGEPSAESRLASIRVLTLQGHPECPASVMALVINLFADKFDEALLVDALKRVGRPTDGISKVGKAIWGVLGVE